MARILMVVACLTACGALPAFVHAQDYASEIDPIDIPPEHDPLAHAWDRPGDRGGFYLRGVIGLGANSTRLGPAPWESGSGDARATGFATGYTLDVGGFLKPFVALHLNLHAGVLWNGELDSGLALADDDPGAVRIGAFGLAPAVTFVAPHNFLFSAGFGLGLARVEQPGHRNVTDPGFYMSVGLGKDLYAGEHLALGLLMQLVYMRLGDEQKVDEARVRQFLFGFSVAYDSI